ncbi:MAG TPA: FMN-binding protein [Gemmatimonadales bacterium]|nr:FMN-binding protein [Gemmatimonadales bacterium]
MTTAHAHPSPAASAPGSGTPSWRLLTILSLSGALAGGLIVSAYRATLPPIEAHRAARVEAAIREVLKLPARWDTLYLDRGALTKRLPDGANPKAVERVFLGFDSNGNPVGAAITAGRPGFADIINLIFGLDPTSGTLLGMKVLTSKETPGLGDKIYRDSGFVRQFRGAVAPLKGVKDVSGKSQSEVAVITGATISSRTVIRIINEATARWQPLLQAYRAKATP